MIFLKLKKAYAEIHTENMVSRNMGATINKHFHQNGYTVLGVHKICENKVKRMEWFQYNGNKTHNFTKKVKKCRFLN